MFWQGLSAELATIDMLSQRTREGFKKSEERTTTAGAKNCRSNNRQEETVTATSRLPQPSDSIQSSWRWLSAGTCELATVDSLIQIANKSNKDKSTAAGACELFTASTCELATSDGLWKWLTPVQYRGAQ
jgi:hypothetical protein